MSDDEPQLFFVHDTYAARALGTDREVGSSYADSDIYVAGRGVSESVIPDLDESVLELVGSNPAEVAAVEKVLLDRYGRRELWHQYSLPAELQSYVVQLIEHGQLFVYYRFERDEGTSFTLTRTAFLAPETMLQRAKGARTIYEQYASRRAFDHQGVVVVGEPKEHLVELSADEVLHLRWPLQEPDDRLPPAQAALALGRRRAKHARRSLLTARASAQTEETFLPLARARAGAFSDALEQQQNLSAAVKDMLFYPGALEADIWPWAQETTDYFRADRMLRSRIGICRIRDYLFREFNRQILRRWSDLNGWGEIVLRVRPTLFDESDWTEMREQLRIGELDLEDVRAAIQAEYDEGHRFSRLKRASGEP